MVLRPQTIKNLRRFIQNMRTPALYCVFSAIRGPDNNKHNQKGNELDFKIITKALRSYIGFDSESCSGDLIYGIEARQIQEQIYKVDSQFKGNHSHYVGHLYYALNAIGRENLISYVRSKNR